MSYIIEFFKSLGDIISSIIDFIINLVTSIVSFFLDLPDYIDIVTEYLDIVPDIFKAFLVMVLTGSLIFVIIGKRGE